MKESEPENAKAALAAVNELLVRAYRSLRAAEEQVHTLTAQREILLAIIQEEERGENHQRNG